MIAPQGEDGTRLHNPPVRPAAGEGPFAPGRAPVAPTLVADFRSGPPAGWTAVVGATVFDDQGLRTRPSERVLLVHEQPFTHLLLEACVRVDSATQSGTFGLVPAYTDEKNHLSVLIDPATRSVRVTAVRNGIGVSLGSAPFAELDPAIWHGVRVRRTFDLLEVWIDGVRAITTPSEWAGPARVGLVSTATAAQCSTLAATEVLSCSGARLHALAHVFRADRLTTLSERGLSATEPLHLLADRLPRDVRLTHDLEVDSPYGQIELVPVVVDTGTFLRLELSAGSYRLVQVSGWRRVELGRGSVEPRTWVQTEVTDSGVTVRVGDSVHRAQIRVGPTFDQSIRLYGATLRSFEMAALPRTTAPA